MRMLLVRNESNFRTVKALQDIRSHFVSRGIAVHDVSSSDLGNPATRAACDALVREGLDLAVVLGGDGTMLRTARLLEVSEVPIFGINFGHLGFLAHPCAEHAASMIQRVLEGEASLERRANLAIEVACESTPHHTTQKGLGCVGGEDAACEPRSFFALNDLVITRGMRHSLGFSLAVAEHELTSTQGDGIVVATSTGSTAYALSAGGPLVAPGFGGMVVVPLAPHTLCARAVLTQPNDIVDIQLERHQAQVLIDGDLVSFENPVSHVRVRVGNKPTVFVRLEGEGFYEHAARAFF